MFAHVTRGLRLLQNATRRRRRSAAPGNPCQTPSDEWCRSLPRCRSRARPRAPLPQSNWTIASDKGRVTPRSVSTPSICAGFPCREDEARRPEPDDRVADGIEHVLAADERIARTPPGSHRRRGEVEVHAAGRADLVVGDAPRHAREAAASAEHAELRSDEFHGRERRLDAIDRRIGPDRNCDEREDKRETSPRQALGKDGVRRTVS